MTILQEHEVAINLKILKFCGFYHVFNPKGTKHCRLNISKISFIVLSVLSLCLLLFGTSGFFFELDDTYTINHIELFVLVGIYIQGYMGLFKLFIFLYNADKIWNMFYVTRLNFLTSAQCSKKIEIMYKYKNKIVKMTNLFFIFTFIADVQWFIFPLIVHQSENTINHRKMNIMNLRFPVTVDFYNEYFGVFYLIELFMIIFFMYIVCLSDLFLISFCSVFCAQYKVLTRAFKNIGYKYVESNNDCTDSHEALKSVLLDQIQLYTKLKLYYSIVQPIVLVDVLLTSIFIILYSYVFILVCTSSKLFSVIIMLRIGSAILWGIFELFLFCYLFNKINIKRELVNFGIYSCNWTEMDLKFKKLLLLAMRMNDANQIMIKASPKKIIDLQLFINVMTTSYNVITVLLNTMKD